MPSKSARGKGLPHEILGENPLGADLYAKTLVHTVGVRLTKVYETGV